MVKARRGTAPCMKVGGQLSLLLPPPGSRAPGRARIASCGKNTHCRFQHSSSY